MLYAIHENGDKRELSLSIQLPRKAEDGRDWMTELTFKDQEVIEKRPSFGVDPISALLLAIADLIGKLKVYESQGYQFHLSLPPDENSAYPLDIFKITLQHMMDQLDPP